MRQDRMPESASHFPACIAVIKGPRSIPLSERKSCAIIQLGLCHPLCRTLPKTSIITQSSGAIPPPLTQISAVLNSRHCSVHRKIYCKTPEKLSVFVSLWRFYMTLK
jgi:hypothetical protein